MVSRTMKLLTPVINLINTYSIKLTEKYKMFSRNTTVSVTIKIKMKIRNFQYLISSGFTFNHLINST